MRRLGFSGAPEVYPGSRHLPPGMMRLQKSLLPQAPPRPGVDLARAGQRVFLAGTAHVPPGAARPHVRFPGPGVPTPGPASAPQPRPVPVLERPLPAGPGGRRHWFPCRPSIRCLLPHRFRMEDSVSQDTMDKKGEKMRKQLNHEARQGRIQKRSPSFSLLRTDSPVPTSEFNSRVAGSR